MENNNIVEELKCILDAIPYEVTLKNLKGNYKYGNKRFLQNVNCTEKQIYDKNVSLFFDSNDCNEIQMLDREVYNKNKGVFYERKLRTVNNNERWFNMYKVPLSIRNGNYILTLSQEVTFNKKIVNLMEYELEKDSHDVLGYHDVLYDYNETDKISDDEYKNRITILCKNLSDELNAAYITIYLYDEENNDLNLYICTCDKNNSEKQKIELGDKKFFKVTNTEVIVDQKILHELYSSNLYELNICEIKYGNNIIGIMNIYYEKGNHIKFEQNDLIKSTCYKFGLLFQNKIISKKLKEEERKKIEYKQALDTELLKTEFFASISHEIRTPLNIIMAATQLIRSTLKNCECEKCKDIILKNINYIKQNSNRLVRLINNIGDVNKIDSGYNNLKYVNYNIIEVIENIVLSVADYIKSSGRTVIFDTDEEEIIMACDEEKIERIMLNLLSNAIKYSYENTDIVVKVKLNENRSKIIVSVWDDGISIDKKDSKRIFDKFVQLDNLLSRPCEGSGIGLYLVKLFVELHEGEIWVNNEVDKGAEIDFSIPIKVVNEKDICSHPSNIKTKVEECDVEFSDIYSL